MYPQFPEAGDGKLRITKILKVIIIKRDIQQGLLTSLNAGLK